MASVDLYMASVTGNVDTKKKQQKIIMILEGKKIPFNQIDITADSSAKERMRQLSSNPTALPPQLANGDSYCGDYEAFEAAVEEERINEFLKI